MARVRQLKAVGLDAANAKALADLINNYTAGLAAGGYPAGHVGDNTLIDQQYMSDGTTYSCVLFYLT